MNKVLVVDDEMNMLFILEAMLKQEGYDVVTAPDGVAAFDVVKAEDVAVVVTDLKMPRLDGLGLLKKIEQHFPSLPVIMITAHGTVATAVEAIKQGAFDYITKPFDQEDLKNVVRKAFKTRAYNEDEVVPTPDEVDHYDIIGDGDAMRRVYALVRKVAPTTTTVLITGETGTGKELIAGAVHRTSDRRDHPFIKINCAAIAENLVESELFGFEKGAFTGAVHRKPGRFELAHRGTLFLDEIGELSTDMQAKLLRVIQDQEFERVGGLKTIKVDVRLVAATNKNLLDEVDRGSFREDLYYRLNVMPIHLPSLRERRDDIPALTNYFLEKFNEKLDKNVRAIDPAARERLAAYPWPGNIRELENLIERIVLLKDGDTVGIGDLSEEVRRAVPPSAMDEGDLGGKTFKEIIKAKTAEIERAMIKQTLDDCGGNVSKAAAALGLSRKGLQLKMIKYDLRDKTS